MEATEKIRIYDKGVEPPGVVSYTQAPGLRFGDIKIPRIEMTEPLWLECAHFLDCVRTRRPPRTDGRSGAMVVKILEAAGRSLRDNGRPIEV